jgi:hypothetical protein
MQDSLRALIGRIGSGVGEISGAAQALSAVTEQTRLGVEEQKSETIQVATAMQEMAYTVQEVASNAGQAANVAQLICEEAGKGNQVVRDTIAQIERLAAHGGGTAERGKRGDQPQHPQVAGGGGTDRRSQRGNRRLEPDAGAAGTRPAGNGGAVQGVRGRGLRMELLCTGALL